MFAISFVARLDPPRLVGIGDVERHQRAEAGVADDLTAGWSPEPVGEQTRALGLPGEAHLQRLEPAEQEPGDVRAPRSSPVRERNSSTRAAVSVLAKTSAPTSASSCPARYFVAEWSAMSQPRSSGLTLERRRRRRVAEDERRVRGRGLEVRHRQERVRGRLEPDEVDAVGRRPGLVELDVPDAPALELAEQRPCRSTRPRRARRSGRARAARGRPPSTPRRPTRRAAPRRRRARRARAPPRRRSGSRSARTRTRRLAVLVRPRRRAIERDGTRSLRRTLRRGARDARVEIRRSESGSRSPGAAVASPPARFDLRVADELREVRARTADGVQMSACSRSTSSARRSRSGALRRSRSTQQTLDRERRSPRTQSFVDLTPACSD